MVVHFLLLVRNIDGDEVGVLDVAHLDLVLFKSVSCLVFSMIESTVKLLTAVLNLLTYTVVFALRFAQICVLAIPFFLELRCIVSMQLAQVFVSTRERLQRIGELCDEGTGELLVFGCALFEGV